MTFSITTLSITILSIMCLFATLSINGTWHTSIQCRYTEGCNDFYVMLIVTILCVVMLYVVMLYVVMVYVVMLSVIMLSVVAP